ncbi:hypothetical protein ACWIFB_13425 [Dietzia sp. NPDC055340]
MGVEDHDPEEYTPDPDPVTAREEYEPAPVDAGSVGEADPADVAEQSVEVPVIEPGPEEAEEYDDEEVG